MCSLRRSYTPHYYYYYYDYDYYYYYYGVDNGVVYIYICIYYYYYYYGVDNGVVYIYTYIFMSSCMHNQYMCICVLKPMRPESDVS